MSQAQKLPDFSLMTKEEMESFIKEQMAKANAKKAGVEQYIDFSVKDMANYSSSEEYGLIISNPPYGDRLSSKYDVKNTYKKLVACDLNDNIIQEFESRKAAVLWLQKNNYTKATNIDNINAVIGRAANGKRATAYGMKWKNI